MVSAEATKLHARGRNNDGPVFHAPWEAQAFALALSLHERGVFTWHEWTATLGDEIKKAQAAGDPDTGETYYHHWLVALERLVARKGLTDAETLARTCKAWRRASARTPHGIPIELKPDDFVGSAPRREPQSMPKRRGSQSDSAGM